MNCLTLGQISWGARKDRGRCYLVVYWHVQSTADRQRTCGGCRGVDTGELANDLSFRATTGFGLCCCFYLLYSANLNVSQSDTTQQAPIHFSAVCMAIPRGFCRPTLACMLKLQDTGGCSSADCRGAQTLLLHYMLKSGGMQ